MQGEFYHNSYVDIYRLPFGAAKCNTEITLRLQVPINFYGYCTLRLWINDEEKLISMRKVDIFDDELRESKVYYETSFKAPTKPGLVWYYFCVADDRTVRYYGNNPSLRGGEGWFYDNSPPAYQITIYKETITPNWWKDGVMYQIFPDRFCNGNADMKVNSPKSGSLLQANWNDMPSYQKDEDGKIMSWIFAGGNIKGITSKLEYLQDMGITIIYLNPIFESRSSHRYDVADYKKIDPMLGTDEDFDEMIAEGKRRGIGFILDGVFSHTGHDSIYFNKLGNYDSVGAYQSKDSQYYSWYKFKNYPEEYECWWGVGDLPNVDELNPSFQNYICKDEDSVIRTWIRRGVMGFRLDVADELPDEFIKLIRKTIKEENQEAVLIGEVWEDASNKHAYGVMKEYYYGEELDGVMNYPFREALLDFALDQITAFEASSQIMGIMENSPRENLLGSMTMLGTHDRPRLLTVLGSACSSKGEDYQKRTNKEKQEFKLSKEIYQRAKEKSQMVTALLYALPGTPSIYYGDEAGLEGFMDPYNRGTFPWGKEDKSLQGWYYNLCHIRKEYLNKFIKELYEPISNKPNVIGFKVRKNGETLYIFSNKSENSEEITFGTELQYPHAMELIEGGLVYPKENINEYKEILPPISTRIYLIKDGSELIKIEKSSGILLHPSSLGGDFDIGDLGVRAYQFIDFLEKTGQRIWQILPLNITGESASPYQVLSSYAGNPLLISMDKLVDMGLLEEKELNNARTKIKIDKFQINIEDKTMANEKYRLLKLAYKKFFIKGEISEGAEEAKDREKEKTLYFEFVEKNKDWLEDFALFDTLYKNNHCLPWYKWEDKGLKERNKLSVEKAKEDYKEEIRLCYFIQFIFYEQWNALREYANSKGVIILGDVPICVSPDSADVWINPKLFKLNEDGSPSKILGVPPDFFSKEGQLWGMPVFDWREHKQENYRWWKNRISYELSKVDYVKLDHFRGFVAHWEVDAKEINSKGGKWKSGGGVEFFEELEKSLGKLNIIVEDLGHITVDVKNLKNYFNYPGMEIYQFSDKLKFENGDLDYFKNTIVYTGTHDNDTLLSWIINEEQLKDDNIEDIAKVKAKVKETISKLCNTSAPWVIIPMQDLLGLGHEARMNLPGTVSKNNWSWKLSEENYEELSNIDNWNWLIELIKKSGR